VTGRLTAALPIDTFTATWLSSTSPELCRYCRATHHWVLPFFGKAVPSTIQAAKAVGSSHLKGRHRSRLAVDPRHFLRLLTH
jgi:hypothetical protein